MPASIPTRLSLLAGFALSLLPCAAQQGADVTLQFLSFPKSIDPQPVELLLGNGRTISVQIPTNEFSPTYKVKRQKLWAVGKTVTGEDGKTFFKVFGKTRALASPKQLILLVRKGAKNSDGMAVIPIDNQVGHFGGGSFLFMNASKLDVGGRLTDPKGRIATEEFALQPGRHTVVKPNGGGGGRNLVHTSLFYREGDKVKPFFSSTWPLNDKARAMVFFYRDPTTGHLRLHSIRDFL